MYRTSQHWLVQTSNRNTETMFDVYSKLTIKTPERRHKVALVSLLLTLNRFQ